MKILVFGPRDRYDVYRPPFADEMPVELVFRRPDQTYVQAAQENADARIIFVDAITDVGPDVMDQLPSTARPPGSGGSMCATIRGATRNRWRSTPSC